MSLYAYNLTTSPIVLAGIVPAISLPATRTIGQRGKAFNVTGEFKRLNPAHFAALEAQAIVGATVNIHYEWTGTAEEYPTPGLTVWVLSDTDDPLPPVVDNDPYPALPMTVVFGEPPEGELGQPRSILFLPAVAYRRRILNVSCRISRGYPEATMYLCASPDGSHEPYSDKFDASQPGQLQETTRTNDPIIDEGEEVFAFCSNDYVRGSITALYHRIA